jgi:hypothetical protein
MADRRLDLYYACAIGSLAAVERLLVDGSAAITADIVRERDHYALWVACVAGRRAVVERLFARDPSTPLFQGLDARDAQAVLDRACAGIGRISPVDNHEGNGDEIRACVATLLANGAAPSAWALAALFGYEGRGEEATRAALARWEGTAELEAAAAGLGQRAAALAEWAAQYVRRDPEEGQRLRFAD